MPYLHVENNKLIAVYANSQPGFDLINAENEPEPAPSVFHSFSVEKGWYLTSEDSEKLILQKNEIRANENKEERRRLRVIAEDHIQILERKVKAKRATESEKQLLDALYNFTIDLDELDLSQETVFWPVMPK